MYEIKYEIGLNEEGRPYIGLPDDYEQRPEDRFFALEIARYILADLLNRRTVDLDEETVDNLIQAEAMLGQLGDNVAGILYGVMKNMGETHLLVDPAYHIEVLGIEARDALPDKDIIYNGRIYERIEGLKVYVNFNIEDYDGDVAGVYELKEGTTNEHWVKL